MSDQKKKQRNFFTDIWRKVIALFLAIFVWYSVNQQVSVHYPEYDVVVPLKLECADENVILPEKTPDVVLRVKTSLSQQELISDRFEVKLPILENSESIPDNGMRISIHGNSRFRNTKRPPFTKVVSYSINSNVFIDKRIVRKLPVRVAFTGNLPDGLEPQFIVTPSEVLVEGPSSTLAGVNHVFTSEIDISDAKDESNFFLPLVMSERRIRLYDSSRQDKVKVKLKTVKSENLDTVVFKDLPVRVLCHTPQRLMLKGDVQLRTTVTFRAEMRTLAAIRTMELKPYIDISGIPVDKSTAVLPLQLDLPKEIANRIFQMVKSPSEFKVELFPVESPTPVDDSANEK